MVHLNQRLDQPKGGMITMGMPDGFSVSSPSAGRPVNCGQGKTATTAEAIISMIKTCSNINEAKHLIDAINKALKEKQLSENEIQQICATIDGILSRPNVEESVSAGAQRALISIKRTLEMRESVMQRITMRSSVTREIPPPEVWARMNTMTKVVSMPPREVVVDSNDKGETKKDVESGSLAARGARFLLGIASPIISTVYGILSPTPLAGPEEDGAPEKPENQ